MAGYDSAEENKGDAERNAFDFQFSQRMARRHYKEDDDYSLHGGRLLQQIIYQIHLVTYRLTEQSYYFYVNFVQGSCNLGFSCCNEDKKAFNTVLHAAHDSLMRKGHVI
jgi:hypothetical protein